MHMGGIGGGLMNICGIGEGLMYMGGFICVTYRSGRSCCYGGLNR
jgi:hypothetical protein